MSEQIKNHGLNLEMEKKAVSKKDWVLLGNTISEIELDNTVISLDPNKIYDYLPIGELQRGANDFMDCASRAVNNVAETVINYALDNGLIHPENVRWFKHIGYIVKDNNGKEKFESSDRWIAIKSGTTDNGNSLKAPVDTVYKWGLIPKAMFKGSPDMYRSEYLNASKITSAMEDIGKEFKRRFPIQFYKVWKHQFEKCLPTSPVDVAGYAWPRPNSDGVYPNPNRNPNHAFMYFATPKYKIFDNYLDSHDSDYIKRLAEDYLLLQYGYWLVFRQRKLWTAPADGTVESDATEKPKPIKKNSWLTFYEFWSAVFNKITGKK